MIERTHFLDEQLSEVLVNPSTSVGVSISDVRPRGIASDSHGIEVGITSKVRLNIAQACPVSQLGKCHCQKLIPGKKIPASSWHWIFRNATLKLLAMKNVGDLAENEVSLIHATSLNKKTGNVIPSQMRHTQKPLLAPVHRCSSTPWRLLTGQ